MDTLGAPRIAVLIDADNTSHRYAEALLDEVAKFGNPTIKRAYGDWSSQRLNGWVPELNARAIRAMHANAFTTGKNSTDSALIIDAMDLLYSGNVEAFALVTSDSDFTSLALRLRESGMAVYGLGRKRTPASLQNACDRFVQLELLGEETDEDAEEAGDDVQAAPSINLQSAITKAVNATADEDGWTHLGAVGNHLNRTHASFDPRGFGHAKLSSLVAAQPYLETAGTANDLRVRLKGGKTTRRTAKKAPAKAESKAPAKAETKAPAKAPAKAEPKAAAKAPTTSVATAPATEPSVPKVTTMTRATRKSAAKKAAKKDSPSPD